MISNYEECSLGNFVMLLLFKKNFFGLFPAPIQVLKHLRYATCVVAYASDIAHTCATAAHYISSFLL